jgi:hypothetical protein
MGKESRVCESLNAYFKERAEYIIVSYYWETGMIEYKIKTGSIFKNYFQHIL